jgi:hypothetical protein
MNPIRFAARVNEQFLRYQLTAHPLADDRLAEQAQAMVRGRDLEPSPLVKGPYLSLSKPFLMGAQVADLVSEGALHPVMAGVLRFPSLFQHQVETLRAAQDERHCLVATGTGSGKTEAFLAPILDHCLRLRDDGAPEGIVAVLVYPMNALAQDQKLRLREMLRGTGVSYGMYVGSTPARPADVTEPRDQIPAEERPSEAEMRERPPRLLITNYRQLEILLTRGTDQGLFEDAPLRFLVFDEAHTYSGATGAEVACLVRRLRAFCGKAADEVICIGTSATIADPESGEEAGRAFAHRFFGVPAERVALVGERYADYDWAPELMDAPVASTAGEELLVRALAALEGDGEPTAVEEVAREVLGVPLRLGGDWRRDLYGWMQRSRLVHALADLLEKPKHLDAAVEGLAEELARPVADEASARAEILSVLALGAAAQRDGGSLLRPKVHHFVEGLQGVVGLLPPGEDTPRLFMTREDALDAFPDHPTASIWNLYSCETCGQHYFEGWLEEREAALAEEGNAVFPASELEEGTRFLWADVFPVEEKDDSDEVADRLDARRDPVHLCRQCGFLHTQPAEDCANPRCLEVGAVFTAWQMHLADDGRLKSCPVCKAGAGRAREPIRRFRAATTADNHVLAQDMIQAAGTTEARKLILFTDNRQDAAFQAGWMADRARRYRFRHLMLQFLREAGRPLAIGDFVERFLKLFREDRGLARALCPEVYDQSTDEVFSPRLQEELREYLRIQVLVEWTPGLRNRAGLEVLGLAKVVYAGLPGADDPWILEWAGVVGCDPALFLSGIESWLDTVRRRRVLWDEVQPVFSKRYFGTADPVVARGYLPGANVPPEAMVLRKEGTSPAKITGFWAARGMTNLMFQAGRWGIPNERMEDFCRELWQRVTRDWAHEGRPLLVEAALVGDHGRRLPGAVGARQLDSRLTGMELAETRWTCSVCHRVHLRPTPRAACTRHHCRGTLAESPVPEDHYDLATLADDFAMVQAREHSAQVPHQDRFAIEEQFKKPDGEVNCLVATPTLELGVDIGGLDMVLLRNLPPTPANYWQRVGRAGRQERMAVLYTYCRTAQHDRYFFEDPLRLLEGRVEPPRFNLRNPVMVRKHVHAAAISAFLRAARPADPWRIGDEGRAELQADWIGMFPHFLRGWLLDEDDRYRDEAPSVARLGELVGRFRQPLLEAVVPTFRQAWPEEDAEEVREEVLAGYVDEMPARLQECADRLFGRFAWTRRQLAELNREAERGRLGREKEQQRRRCEAFLRRLLDPGRDNYLLTVLAVEGFLPGYNQLEGGVTAFAGRHLQGGRFIEEFPLARAASLAVREYVPGNKIYANRGQFRLERYRFPVEESALDPVECVVDADPERLLIREVGQEAGGYASDTASDLLVLPVSDCELGYASRIHDQELDRFRLPVTVLGYRRANHRGGDDLALGAIQVQHLRGQGLKLVNVGPNDRVRKGEIGFPVCGGCGAVRSPYDTQAVFDKFEEVHRPHWPQIGKAVGIGADVEVDGFLIRSPSCPELADLASFAEALRRGASRVLEMDEEDLQILPLPSGEAMELFLYDPMPGGSGLLDQLRRHWAEVREAALALCRECPGACETSCYECLRSYRNSFLHQQLDRHRALELLDQGEALVLRNPIAPATSSVTTPRARGTNALEKRTRDWLVGAGLPEPLGQASIVFERPLDWGGQQIRQTRPDFLYRRPDHAADIAIYEDGSPHDRSEVRRRDQLMRDELRDTGWTVVEVLAVELGDETAMDRHIRRIQRRLGNRRADTTSNE